MCGSSFVYYGSDAQTRSPSDSDSNVAFANLNTAVIGCALGCDFKFIEHYWKEHWGVYDSSDPSAVAKKFHPDEVSNFKVAALQAAGGRRTRHGPRQQSFRRSVDHTRAGRGRGSGSPQPVAIGVVTGAPKIAPGAGRIYDF
jgi:hypothetical protein